MNTETLWQENARRFAQRAEDRDVMLARIRANVRAEVLPMLGVGRQTAAYHRVMRGFIEQLRAAGMGYAAIPGLPYECGGPVPAETAAQAQRDLRLIRGES